MKKLLKKYSLGAALLAVLCLLPTSCIKDDVVPTDKASVTLTFTTRATASGESELPVSEQMKNLRVIMAKAGSRGTTAGDILYNVSYPIEPNVGKKTITFNDIEVAEGGTDYDFYAIANEAAFEESYGGTTVDLNALKEKIINTDFNTDLTNGLPQVCFVTQTIEAKADQSFGMQLQFPVAKVRVTFYNNTGTAQTLQSIKMPGAKTDKGYLFAQDVLPTGLQYSDLSLEGISDLADKQSSTTLIGYIYPGQINSGYTLTATWNSRQYTLPLTKDSATITRLNAGECLNIVITLEGKKEATIQWTIGGWDGVGVDVPFS